MKSGKEVFFLLKYDEVGIFLRELFVLIRQKDVTLTRNSIETLKLI